MMQIFKDILQIVTIISKTFIDMLDKFTDIYDIYSEIYFIHSHTNLR